MKRVAPKLQDGLRRFQNHPLVGEVRGIGLIGAVELVADKATKAPFDPVGQVGGAFATNAQAQGLIIRNLGDSIGICPPLIIQEGEIETMLDRFGSALEETASWVSGEGLAPSVA